MTTTLVDNLVQLHIVASDSGSGLGPDGIRVHSVRPASGEFAPEWDVIAAWDVRRAADTLLVTETPARLLSWGGNRLVVTAEDRMGNLAVDTVRLELPAMALYRRLPGRQARPTDAMLCDDGLIYTTAGRDLTIVDPRNASVVGVYPHPAGYDGLGWLYCPPGDSIIYVSPMYLFNRRARQWSSRRVQPGYYMTDMVGSRSNPDLFYAGMLTTGQAGSFSRSANAWVGSLPYEHSSSSQEFVPALAVMPADEKLYISRIYEGGVIVVDPRSRTILRRIDFGHGGYGGDVDAMQLTADDGLLLAAVSDVAYDSELAVVDTRTDAVIKRVTIPAAIATSLAISPSGRRVFVNTQDRNAPSPHMVVDVATWSVIGRLERPRPEGQARIDSNAAFSPDGKLVVLNVDGSVEIYLNRE